MVNRKKWPEVRMSKTALDAFPNVQIFFLGKVSKTPGSGSQF